jgi:hypothetical protein
MHLPHAALNNILKSLVLPHITPAAADGTAAVHVRYAVSKAGQTAHANRINS